MRRRRNYKHKRSYSYGLFDPQRLLYFSTTNQRHGKVIRPKSTAISNKGCTQTVDDQESVLDILNETLQFRIKSRNGSRNYWNYTVFQPLNMVTADIGPNDEEPRLYFDRTNLDHTLDVFPEYQKFASKFQPYTPNIPYVYANRCHLMIPRPAEGLNRPIVFYRAVWDTSLSPIPNGDSVETLDTLTIKWDEMETDQGEPIQSVLFNNEWNNFLAVKASPTLADSIDLREINNVYEWDSTNKTATFNTETTFTKIQFNPNHPMLLEYVKEMIENVPPEDGEITAPVSFINLPPTRYRIVEFLAYGDGAPEVTPMGMNINIEVLNLSPKLVKP